MKILDFTVATKGEVVTISFKWKGIQFLQVTLNKGQAKKLGEELKKAS